MGYPFLNNKGPPKYQLGVSLPSWLSGPSLQRKWWRWFFKNERVEKWSYGHTAIEEKCIQETLQNLVRTVRVSDSWTTSYFLPSPFPAQHETKSTPDGCSQRHRAPFLPVRGLQHPLGRGRMPVFLSLTPAACCQEQVPGKHDWEIGLFLQSRPYSGGGSPLGVVHWK